MVGLALTVGLFGAATTGWVVYRWGISKGFVDRPDDDLKTHTGNPVPLGGVALMVGLHGGMAVVGMFDPGLFLSTAVLFTVGLVDDWKGLSPLFRLFTVAGAGLLLAVASDQVDGGVAIVATVVLVVAAVNAINLLDGLDALAGGVSVVAFAGFAVFGVIQTMAAPWLPLVVAGALVGFLFWNVPPARLYLGDSGAYVVGGALAWAVLQTASDWSSALVGAALIGIPFLDLSVTVARRLGAKRPLFTGDRDHVYDRLRRRGFGVGAIALIFSSGQALWTALLLVLALTTGDRAAIVTAVGIGSALAVAEGTRSRRALSNH